MVRKMEGWKVGRLEGWIFTNLPIFEPKAPYGQASKVYPKLLR
jgi:hypothetical protein